MKEDIKFLKELQEELRTQETDYQAAPRYWVIMDYEMKPCLDGCHREHYVEAPNRDYYGSLHDLLDSFCEDGFEGFSEKAISEFEDLSNKAIGKTVEEWVKTHHEFEEEWLKKYYDPDVRLIPVREEHFVHFNTMFLTKAEAEDHLKLNKHHYSEKAHTFAMTARKAPKVARLMQILETFPWEKLENIIPSKEAK